MDKVVLENEILRKFKRAYEAVSSLLVRVEDVGNTDRALAIINLMATYAWHKHPGRFADLRLEYWAAKIGEKIWASHVDVADLHKQVKGSKQRILHVASETYSVGGHTRLLLNLIQGDSESIHSLVVIRQPSADIPAWLCEAVLASGGVITSLVSESYTKQVASLQRLLYAEADKIFYHIHPDDSVAVAALAVTPRPQVLILNHADHVFWLGSALSDIVVCFREWALKNAVERRNAQKAMLVPIPLNFPSVGIDSKQKAREKLGIKADKVVIITVASFYKFIPSGKYHYFKTIKKILERNPNVLFKIIGVSNTDNLIKIGFEKHDRVELMGVIAKPQLYYEAADIYMDAMPVGSYTSLLEAMYFSCFPVLQYCPINTLNTEEEIPTRGLVVHARDESEQIGFVQSAITDKQFRDTIASSVADRIKDNYVGKGWKSRLDMTYSASSDTVYKIRSLKKEMSMPIVITQLDCEAALLAYSDNTAPDDILARWMSQNLQLIGYLEMIKMFLMYNFQGEFGYNFSLKSFLWLVKKKVVGKMSA